MIEYVMYRAGSMESQVVTTLPVSAEKQDKAFCDACLSDRAVWVDADQNVFYGPHEHNWPTTDDMDAALEGARIGAKIGALRELQEDEMATFDVVYKPGQYDGPKEVQAASYAIGNNFFTFYDDHGDSVAELAKDAVLSVVKREG